MSGPKFKNKKPKSVGKQCGGADPGGGRWGGRPLFPRTERPAPRARFLRSRDGTEGHHSTPFKHKHSIVINVLKCCKSVFAYVRNHPSPSHMGPSISEHSPLAEILDPPLMCLIYRWLPFNRRVRIRKKYTRVVDWVTATELRRLFNRLGSPYHLEPFSGVEIHMEMDMEWKWIEMGYNLWKCYGLVWIWGKAERYDRYLSFIKHDISNTEARLYPNNTAVIKKYGPNLKH